MSRHEVHITELEVENDRLEDMIFNMNIEIRKLVKCKEALVAMRKCPLIIDAGFVPYITSVLGDEDE